MQNETVNVDKSLSLLLQYTQGQISFDEYRRGIAMEDAKREELLRKVDLLSENVS